MKILIKSIFWHNEKISYALKHSFWLLLLPLFLVNRNWLHSGPYASIDSWLYVHYFRDWSLHNPIMESFYKISRLPWILKGTFFHSLFPAYEASLYLHFFIFLLSIVALYICLRAIFNHFTAAISSLLSAYAPLMHALGGQDYHSQDYIASFFLLLLFLKLSMLKPKWYNYLLFGIFFAQTWLLNFYTTLLIPILFTLGLMFIKNQPTPPRKWLDFVIYSTAGFLFFTLALGIINFFDGGTFFYFWPQIKFSLNYQGFPALYKSFNSILLKQEHLFLSLILSLGVIDLLKKLYFKTDIFKDLTAILTVCFLYTYATFIFFHFRNIEIFSLAVTIPIILPFAILLVTSLLNDCLIDLKKEILPIAIYIVLYFCFLFGHSYFNVYYQIKNYIVELSSLVFLLSFSCICIFISFASKRIKPILIIAFLVFNFHVMIFTPSRNINTAFDKSLYNALNIIDNWKQKYKDNNFSYHFKASYLSNYQNKRSDFLMITIFSAVGSLNYGGLTNLDSDYKFGDPSLFKLDTLKLGQKVLLIFRDNVELFSLRKSLEKKYYSFKYLDEDIAVFPGSLIYFQLIEKI